jgi:hypothetical protein
MVSTAPTDASDPSHARIELAQEQVDTLRLYSAGKITSTEAKTTLDVNRWGLLDLLARHGLPLPHVPIEQARSDIARVFGDPRHRKPEE